MITILIIVGFWSYHNGLGTAIIFSIILIYVRIDWHIRTSTVAIPSWSTRERRMYEKGESPWQVKHTHPNLRLLYYNENLKMCGFVVNRRELFSFLNKITCDSVQTSNIGSPFLPSKVSMIQFHPLLLLLCFSALWMLMRLVGFYWKCLLSCSSWLSLTSLPHHISHTLSSDSLMDSKCNENLSLKQFNLIFIKL